MRSLFSECCSTITSFEYADPEIFPYVYDILWEPSIIKIFSILFSSFPFDSLKSVSLVLYKLKELRWLAKSPAYSSNPRTGGELTWNDFMWQKAPLSQAFKSLHELKINCFWSGSDCNDREQMRILQQNILSEMGELRDLEINFNQSYAALSFHMVIPGQVYPLTRLSLNQLWIWDDSLEATLENCPCIELLILRNIIFDDTSDGGPNWCFFFEIAAASLSKLTYIEFERLTYASEYVQQYSPENLEGSELTRPLESVYEADYQGFAALCELVRKHRQESKMPEDFILSTLYKRDEVLRVRSPGETQKEEETFVREYTSRLIAAG